MRKSKTLLFSPWFDQQTVSRHRAKILVRKPQTADSRYSGRTYIFTEILAEYLEMRAKLSVKRHKAGQGAAKRYQLPPAQLSDEELGGS